MSARRKPVDGLHLLRTAILDAVAMSDTPLQGGDVVDRFVRSGWTMPPGIKDVLHAVRWLEGHGLVEWRKAPHRPGKELHLTSAGDEAARQGLADGCRPYQGPPGAAARAPSVPHRASGGVAGPRIAGRPLPSLVRNSDASVRCLPC